MSRTDVHRPIWVIMEDPLVRHWSIDIHQHEVGECDLDVYLAAGSRWVRTNCYRTLWTQAPNLCGCNMCTGRIGRRLARRRERHSWRAQARKLVDTHRASGPLEEVTEAWPRELRMSW